MQNILVTGHTGFIGQHLCAYLQAQHYHVVGYAQSTHGSLDDLDKLRDACQGVDTVFHCAGFAHALDTPDAQLEAQHWHINYQGAMNAFTVAKQAGVKRFILLSSVKAGLPSDLAGTPTTAYGKAKRAAEEEILQANVDKPMHVVCARLAMVYGAGSKGNLIRMAQLIQRGVFPPLPETHNQRSLIHIHDVVSALVCCAENTALSDRVLVIAHSHAPSGAELYTALRQALGFKPSKICVPYVVLRTLALIADSAQTLLRRSLPFNTEVLQKLLCSEVYDGSEMSRLSGWFPAVDLRAGLTQMCQPLMSSRHVP